MTVAFFMKLNLPCRHGTYYSPFSFVSLVFSYITSRSSASSFLLHLLSHFRARASWDSSPVHTERVLAVSFSKNAPFSETSRAKFTLVFSPSVLPTAPPTTRSRLRLFCTRLQEAGHSSSDVIFSFHRTPPGLKASFSLFFRFPSVFPEKCPVPVMIRSIPKPLFRANGGPPR